MSITITPHAEGATLAVRAQPGARKNAVVGEQAGALKVAVTAPPEDGRRTPHSLKYCESGSERR